MRKILKFFLVIVISVLVLFVGLVFAIILYSNDDGSLQSNTKSSQSSARFDLSDIDVFTETVPWERISPFFYTLDYSSSIAEAVQIPEKISVQLPDDSSTLPDSSVIPGVRKLSDYTIKYATKKLTIDPRISVATNSPSAEQNQVSQYPSSTPVAQFLPEEGPFRIVDWGPQGVVPAELSKPVFYVEFSHPAKNLESLSDIENFSSVMTINPPLKGVFRWNGTKTISFEAEDSLEPGTDYQIVVSDNVKSLGGKSLEGEKVFNTKTSPLKFILNRPGAMESDDNNKGWWYYDRTKGITAPRVYSCLVVFNYPLEKETVLKNLTVAESSYGSNLSFSATPTFSDSIYNLKLSNDGKKTNAYFIKIEEPVHINSTITINIKNSNEKVVYHTLTPFSVKEGVANKGYKDKNHPYAIEFSQSIDIDSVASSVFYTVNDGEMNKITKDNFEVDENYLYIFNLPVEIGETYSLYISTDLKDISGQYLVRKYLDDIYIPEYPGYAKVVASGICMLEAKYAPKFLFEHMNLLPGSAYQLKAIGNPLPRHSDNELDLQEEGVTQIDISNRNTREFVELDLNPLLKNGYGFVQFKGSFKTNYYDYRGEKRTYTNNQKAIIQVTDLGITTRFGVNKAVVMVRSLSTNKPVEDANVFFYKNVISKVTNDIEETDIYKTDKNGMVVIPFDSYRWISSSENRDVIAIYVQKGDDTALFYPNSHSAFSSGVYNYESISSSLKKVQRTFFFSDRGIYKPGETISFRGIDRTQFLGELLPYKYGYSVDVVENLWSSDKSYGTFVGKTSESGGFFGSITLDKDMKPGSYKLLYRRNGEAAVQAIDFTVSYFERVKIQANIEMPYQTMYAGDSIEGNLSASYLAGGALSGKKYNAYWYTQPTTFVPSDVDFKKYTFCVDEWESRRLVSQSEGILNTKGNAAISYSSGTGLLKGMPYTYRLETSVTDESNQKISTSNSVVVHSSDFYIGIANAPEIQGFAKQNQKLSFPCVLLTPNNELYPSKTVDVELSFDYWTQSYQKSVDDSVYVRYVKEKKIDSTSSVKIDKKGVITVTPKNAGWYTLKVSSSDSKNRDVITEHSFYVTGSGATWGSSDDSEMLRLTPDKELYNPGDTAKVLLESPLPSGDYLITVEREGIFTEEIRHFDESCNVLDIPIANNYVPVVYVSVASYSVRDKDPSHEYGQEDLGKPKGFFGVTPVFIDQRVRAFSIDIKSDKKEYAPGETATVTLKATRGGTPVPYAELTLMAVDRGILDLINYHVPNPIDFFYNPANFPLSVHGGDSRNLLMDPVTYSIKNLQGGDASFGDKNEDERKDFRPTAVFEPVLITDKNGEVQYSFKLPDSLTTYRLTAFGVKGKYFALHETEVIVKQKLNVQSVQPRRLRVRDTGECGVLITNTDSKNQQVKVKLEIRSPQSNSLKNSMVGRKSGKGEAFVDGKNEHTIKIGVGQSSVVYFDVGAILPGDVELVYSISSDVLNETLVSPIIIEQPYLMETVTSVGIITPDSTGVASVSEGISIPEFAFNSTGSLSVSLDATRLGLLGNAVNYLFDYPYGCLEQQTGQVLPLLIFGDYIDVFNLDTKIEDKKNVLTSFFSDWEKVQLEDGGFPYWTRDTNSNPFVSLRMAYIYYVAMKNGYNQIESYLDISKLKRYLKTVVSDSKYDSFLRAYVYYVFALLGDKNLDPQLETLAASTNLDFQTMAIIGLASLHSQTDSTTSELAKKMEANIRPYIQSGVQSVSITQMSNTKYINVFYNSKVMQLALITEFFTELNPNDSLVDKLLFTLMQEQRFGYWQNTAVTSEVLSAFDRVIEKRNLSDTNITASASLQDVPIVQGSFKGEGAKTISKKLLFSEAPLLTIPKNATFPLNIVVNGKGQLHYNMRLSYALPDEMQVARNEGFAVSYKIFDAETLQEVPFVDDGVLTCTLESGKTYITSVNVSSSQNRTFAALRCPVPSGSEILDSSLVTTGTISESNANTSNRAIYDNEIQYFWNDFISGNQNLEFSFRATRRGVYPVTPTQIECMYESEIFGRSEGVLFIIK